VPPWQAAHAGGVGGVAVLVRWQLVQVGYTAACFALLCVASLPWQLSQGPIPPTALVNVGRALAFVVTSDALRAMAASKINNAATG